MGLIEGRRNLLAGLQGLICESPRNRPDKTHTRIAPYAIGKTREFYGAGDRTWQATAGGELTWKLTSQLVTVFTVNTDFAETEVDSRQINLTRFPLFFPENRAFFLEGANQYDFGLGLGGQDAQFIPFFSRRIGLLGGAQIPIDAGVKLNGRVGKWNLALLDVQTRDTVIPSAAQQDLGLTSPVISGTNLLAGRVSYDYNDNLRIGTIFTHGIPRRYAAILSWAWMRSGVPQNSWATRIFW